MELLIRLTSEGILVVSSLINYILREIGWFIIVCLAKFSNGLEKTVTKIYTLNGFFNSPEVTNLINKYKPIIWVILAISIAIVGIKIIFNRKSNRDQLPSNLIFSICVVTLLPIFMLKMNTITMLGINDLQDNKSSANQVIKSSLSDLYYLDKIEFKTDGEKNNIADKNILNIDINEGVDPNKINSVNKDTFKKKIVTDDDGNLKREDLEKGIIEWDEEYYRYNMDFVLVIITLLTTVITLACIGLKVARIIFELAFNKLFATIMAFADIDDGKKIREIVKHIGCMFAVLFAMSIMLKLYLIFTAWLSNGNNGTIDGITKTVVLIGVSFGVVDGPNIIERILGIDAGIKNGGLTSLMGAYGLAKGATSAVSNASKLVKNGVSKGAVGGAIAVGATKGLIKPNSEEDSSSNSLKNEMKNNQNKTSSSNDSKNGLKNENSTLKSEMNKDNKQGTNSTLQEDMKGSNSVNGSTLQEDMSGLKNDGLNSNSQNGSSTLQEEMKGSSPVNGATTLQEDMKGHGDISNMSSNRPIKEEMKGTNLANGVNGSNINNTSKQNNTQEIKTPKNNVNLNSNMPGSKSNGNDYNSKIIRAYKTGYNFTSKWDVPNKIHSFKNKKGGNK